ncbi:MAG: tol-pal system protein YbgF [Desulfomicrobiaceae bacterium]|nr:tol-pal system protein YbgF [Desulfomicrobiaceae bacterium]
MEGPQTVRGCGMARWSCGILAMVLITTNGWCAMLRFPVSANATLPASSVPSASSVQEERPALIPERVSPAPAMPPASLAAPTETVDSGPVQPLAPPARSLPPASLAPEKPLPLQEAAAPGVSNATPLGAALHEEKAPSANGTVSAEKPSRKPLPSSPSVVSPASPQALYDAAMEAYLARRYAAARTTWKHLLVRYGASSLAPNARYWIGETWYAQGRLMQAIWAWEEVLRLHPRHAKASDALFKIALSWHRMGKTQAARALWRRVMAEYPGTSAAQLARQRLAGS